MSKYYFINKNIKDSKQGVRFEKVKIDGGNLTKSASL